MEPTRDLYSRSLLDSDLVLNFSSRIIDQELDGFNIISTTKKADIWSTMHAINATKYAKVYIERS